MSSRHAKVLPVEPGDGAALGPRTETDALLSEFAELEARQAAFLAVTRRFLAATVGDPPAPSHQATTGVDLRARLASYERSLILWALARAGGQQLEAARLLCIQPTTLNEKMKRLGIGRPGGDQPGPFSAA